MRYFSKYANMEMPIYEDTSNTNIFDKVKILSNKIFPLVDKFKEKYKQTEQARQNYLEQIRSLNQ